MCDVNHKDEEGFSPLHVACEGGWDDVVAFLLEFGCNSLIFNKFVLFSHKLILDLFFFLADFEKRLYTLPHAPAMPPR